MTRRYFLVKVPAHPPISAEQFNEAIQESVRKHFGDFGLARIDPKLVRFNARKAEAIVACRRNGAEDLEAAMALIPEAAPITIRMSGTIKGLVKKR